MLIRALIVVLAMLNVGVALWWITQGGAAPAVPVPAARAGVATLELLPTPAAAPVPGPPLEAAATESEPSPATATAVAETPAAPAAAAVAQQCLSLGPFADRDAAQAALERAGAQALRPRLRESAADGASNYRVMLPAAASREEAQATVKRIVEAGIGDYYVIAQGEEANAIALGQYRQREGAERRQAALVAAGFPAQLVASGGQSRWWIDATLAAGTTAAALQARSGAPGQRSLECARLR
ncbi:SPOR domain-containing protein [Flavobacterium sp. MXW15]|uniref:SPOR domain-containing protein n=1 Tax=Xanthomonas chitinilytica TaxID=2989819 RepID=A0ABT3K061_9XANT|nr:SPOR domain-containing protein [Xanthomonas sp. H13-6]MCW4456415.1 SPOR domain-containing protein [Flavobacterium sp. MXW15]MCW4474120.1 SPOR domain-containing protein [Xanthomonas sp. H13-6]